MPNILVNNNFYHGTTQACIVDLTPPTFAGVVNASVQSRGQIRASWAAASDVTAPVRYEIYAQANTAVGLFTNPNNVVGITTALQFDFWTLRDGSFLVNGTTYHVGVRARDGVSNIDNNTVSIGVLSTGVFTSADVYKTEGAFALNSSNQLQGTLWALKNSTLAKTGNAVMGTASYQIYDKNGNPVVGMTESGIVADANGQYKIAPVASSLNLTLDHYMAKINITVDGAVREGYTALIQEAPKYDISGLFFVDKDNNFDGTFWVSADEVLKTTGLGTAAYQVFDHNGNPIVGMSQTGITADVNGIYKIAATPSLLTDLHPGYSVRVTLEVDSVTRVEMFAIQTDVAEFFVKAQFSINATNQLRASFWAESSEGKVATTGLGTASYTVYDADGNAVVGLTQTGIAADANGIFAITPVSAILLTDLTHYTVKVTIVVNGQQRVAYKGFSLLGN
jgi:hypothetical protein